MEKQKLEKLEDYTLICFFITTKDRELLDTLSISYWGTFLLYGVGGYSGDLWGMICFPQISLINADGFLRKSA